MIAERLRRYAMLIERNTTKHLNKKLNGKNLKIHAAEPTTVPDDSLLSEAHTPKSTISAEQGNVRPSSPLDTAPDSDNSISEEPVCPLCRPN